MDVKNIYEDAVHALNRNDWLNAQRLAMSILRQHPEHAGIPFVAGVASMQLGQMPLAAELLKRAHLLNPSRADYAAQYARALASGRFTRESCEIADKAMALAPTDPMTLDTLGVVYTQANEHHKAIAAFRQAVDCMPDEAGFRFNLATSLTFSGDLQQAEQQYLACLQRAPDYWKAYLALSQLRRQQPDDNHVQAWQARLAEYGHDREARLYLQLALAKEYEDLRQYPQAFDALTAGKSAMHEVRGSSSQRDQRIFDAIRSAWLSLPTASTPASDSAEPIFILGMPRSGTTLVERIISSHPDVHSAGELQNFSVLLKRASGSRSAEMLDVDTLQRLAGIDWKALGDGYVQSTRPGTGRHPRFIDKLPHNFLYAGFIARALPNAKIICLQRNPMDTCLGNFKQLFALSSRYYDYSFDLMDAGRYYLMYRDLMAFWQQQLPGRILQIQYEDIVEAQERKSRELLEFCGLPWDDACLEFHRNDAPVATASAIQVRSPIYRDALQRWKKYESQLQPLRTLLESAGVAI
ncbi:tetratricopeptide repeat-containing sulfotransferase family protein [Pseudoxanthomonas dokdonensis]